MAKNDNEGEPLVGKRHSTDVSKTVRENRGQA